jgi:hypothetical protein
MTMVKSLYSVYVVLRFVILRFLTFTFFDAYVLCTERFVTPYVL